MRFFLNSLFIVSLLLSSCSDDVTQRIVVGKPSTEDIFVSFQSSSASIIESEKLNLTIVFSAPTSSAGELTLSLESSSGTLNENYKLSTAPVDGLVTLPFIKESSSLNLEIEALIDTNELTETLTFQLTDVSGEPYKISNPATFRLTINDELTTDPKYASCQPALSELSIATWNLEFFPIEGNTTVNAVQDIIDNLNVDIIGVQEINDPSAFETLVSQLDRYDGFYRNVSGSLELGYIYKKSKIESVVSTSTILTSESYNFPRAPLVTKLKLFNGETITLINLHLKCCDDGEERRLSASGSLKAYIDGNMATENVIVLGDYNDDILPNSPFTNFISDTENYKFADASVATGSSSLWSYPSWPSHLDHILISNELFDNFISAETILINGCVSNYYNIVSDHRPVVANFSFQ